MKIIKGGITAPLGFRASGIACGIKESKKKDLALIFSVVPAVACGAFTSNRVKAASVLLTQKRLKNNRAQAVLVNSGNANCLTGKDGLKDAMRLTKALAKGLNAYEEDAIIASTGIIGRRLPVLKIESKMNRLIDSLSRKGSRDASLAIMTTDTRPKEIAVKLRLGKNGVRIGGIAKGSGMIAPNLATMLCFVTTDACITPAMLKAATRAAMKSSFNCITVDGDMSTNDSVIVMANGLAGNARISRQGKDFGIFSSGLSFVTESLAKMLVRDGEGATKLIEVEVRNARTPGDAKGAAQGIANSNLVKTAIYGNDPNWGRIAAAAGASSANFDANKIDISIGNKIALRNGSPGRANERALKRAVSQKDVRITVDLKAGKEKAHMWTCDLTERYVRINAEYRT